jgi:hypothetical protein
MGFLIKKKKAYVHQLFKGSNPLYILFYFGRGLYPPDWLNVNPDS